MDLTVLESSNSFMIKWFEEYSNLNSQQYDTFLKLVQQVQDDMTIFYKMNEVLDNDIDTYAYDGNGWSVSFTPEGESFKLESSFGNIVLDYYAYKTILSKIVDIYSETYPLGTVVEINSNYLIDMIPIEDDEPIKLVILNRFLKFTDGMFFYYTGVLYPLVNSGTTISMVHFNPIAIDKVVHMGYTDEQDTQYVGITKKEMLIDMGLHSTTITTKEEQEIVSNQAVKLEN